jgi:protein CpxP
MDDNTEFMLFHMLNSSVPIQLKKGFHMTTMTTLRKNFVIGLTVLGLGATSLAAHADGHQADPAKQQAHAAKMEQRVAKMEERVAKRQDALHEKLNLSAAQETAWTTFTATNKPGARWERPDRAAMKAMSAPQRMEKRIAMSKERIVRQETRLADLTTFYSVLTAEQKKTFDANMQGRQYDERHGHQVHATQG